MRSGSGTLRPRRSRRLPRDVQARVLRALLAVGGQQWEKFWKRTRKITDEEAKPIFRELFPTFRGEAPFGRESFGKHNGRPDDAQIMDEPLFQQLKKGFSNEVTLSIEDKAPDVIFTTDEYYQDPDGDFPWPKTGTEGERWWVVIIDYHW